jgi:hypothetical protein
MDDRALDDLLVRIDALEKQCIWLHRQVEILKQKRIHDAGLIASMLLERRPGASESTVTE